MRQAKSLKFTGITMALAAASLAGCASGTTATAGADDVAKKAMVDAGKADLVHCYGVNKCRGHNDCKTADNSCSGQATCNGTGFVGIPSKACDDIDGTQKDDWKGSIAKADLIHCSGINYCKGHNDCKTANNACAGQATCKGTGFVSIPSKACDDLGGTIS